MKTYIDINNWNRKEHFHFFKSFEEPFHGITTDVTCTHAYHYCKSNTYRFFLFYLHKVLKSINSIENFRMRIEGEKVALYNKINAAPTIGREDHTFGFSFIEYDEDFDTFHHRGVLEIERVSNTTGLCLSELSERADAIHFSSLPWTSFTSLSHARKFSIMDSIPKITVGKLIMKGDEYLLPISVHAHHALVDGYHLSLLIERIKEHLSANTFRFNSSL
jgi:chloramphenicol O-acetyltransferase type A